MLPEGSLHSQRRITHLNFAPCHPQTSLTSFSKVFCGRKLSPGSLGVFVTQQLGWRGSIQSLLCRPTEWFGLEKKPKIIEVKPPQRGADGKDAQPLIPAFGFTPEPCPEFIFFANLLPHPKAGRKWGNKSVVLAGPAGLGMELRFAALLPSREMLRTLLTCICWAWHLQEDRE